MKKKNVKYIIALCLFLGLLFVFIFSFEGIKTRFIIFFSKTPSRTCQTVECAKEKGTFLWEYEIPVKEIFYEDSIRKIHLKMENAFAEKKWALDMDSPNYVYIFEEYSRIVVPCEYFNLPKEGYEPEGRDVTWRMFSSLSGMEDVKNLRSVYSNCGTHPRYISFHYQDYRLPPDTLTAYILAINMDDDRNPLPGNKDTLVSFSLYKKNNNQ